MTWECFYCHGETKNAPYTDAQGIGYAACCNRDSISGLEEQIARQLVEIRMKAAKGSGR